MCSANRIPEILLICKSMSVNIGLTGMGGCHITDHIGKSQNITYNHGTVWPMAAMRPVNCITIGFCLEVIYSFSKWLDKGIRLTDKSAPVINLGSGFLWSWRYSRLLRKLFCKLIGVYCLFFCSEYSTCICHDYASSSYKSLERYLFPLSGKSTTMFFPLFSGLLASSTAAQSAAPEEIPISRPSFFGQSLV